MSNTTYHVKLEADGRWKWTVAPEPKVRASFYNKFPADTTPGYLVDLGEGYMSLTGTEPNWPWKTVSVQNLYDDDSKAAEVLSKQGWAAISYAWGEYLPKHAAGYPIRPVYPGTRAQEGLPLGYEPSGASDELKAAWSWPMAKVTQFGVADIKKVFAALKKRFVWWDIACIPQQDNRDGYWDPNRKDASGKVIGFEPPPLKFGLGGIKNAEVAKQKYVYGKAAVGAVWLSAVTFSAGGPISNIKSLLLKLPQTLGQTTIDAIFKDSLSLKTDPKIAQQILQAALGISEQDSTKADVWMKQIESFASTLTQVRKEDPWFRSLWSFQEGRLMEKQAFIDREGKTLTIDGTIKTDPVLPFPQITVKVGDKFVKTEAPNVYDLTNTATLLAGQASLAYVNVYGNGTITKPIQALVDLWKSQGGAEPWLSTLQRTLSSSGILYHPEDAPLELLAAARRARFPSFFAADDYFAMIGVLGLIKVDEDNDFSMKDAGNYSKYQDDPKHFVTYLTDDLPKYFFKALVKKYQWLMLLFAKKPKDKVSSWKALSFGHFESINPYCEGLILGNEFMDQPQEWAYSLPALEYDELSDEIIISPPPGFVTQPIMQPGNANMITYPARKITAWTVTKDWNTLPRKPVRYTLEANAPDYIDDEIAAEGKVSDMSVRPSKPSNKVILQEVTSVNDLGGADNFLLIPFKSLGFAMSRLGQDSVEGRLGRCLIVTYAAKGMLNNKFQGYFGGIMDVPLLETKTVEVEEIRLRWQA